MVNQRNDSIRKHLEWLKIILEALPGNVYWKDTEGRYLGCNWYQTKLLGFEHPKDIIGKTDYDLPWGKAAADKIVANDKEVLRTCIPKIVEERGKLPDGSLLIGLTHKVPLFLNGKVVGVLGVSFDITDRKKIENLLLSAKKELKEALKWKSQIIENMQHDFRTPTAGVMQALSYLCNIEKSPQKLEFLKLALGSSEALMALLNDIVEADKKDYTNPILDQPIKLEAVFESVSRLHAAGAAIKRLKFHYHIDKNIPTVIISDKYRLERILLNLVGNAVKFTEQGEVFFEGKLVKQDGRKLLIEFKVKDTGIGIPEDKKNIIFERFVRLDPSNRGIYKGLGLGLTNVREYVRDLEGEFRPIESAKDSGTTFSILIPMKASLDQGMNLPSVEKPTAVEPTQPQTGPVDVQTAPLEKTSSAQTTCGNLLLVEDSLPAQFMMKSVMKAIGCNIDIAGTAEDALDMIQQKSYDLIFADIGLPGMDGIEMTRHIRYDERKKGGKRIPIVGQSANASTANRKACIEAGMQDLLPKPLNTRVVKEVLRNYAEPYALSQPVQPFTLVQIRNTQIIDQDALMGIFKDTEMFKSIFNETKQSTLEDIDAFKEAYRQKDWKRVLFLTHKIRGVFVYMAASRVEEACHYLEDYLKSHKAPGQKALEHMYQLIVTELDKALEAVDKL